MSSEPTPRVLLPSMLAGPMVVLFLMTAFWSASFTQPVVLTGELAGLFILLPLAAVVGVGPALLANAIGTVVMIKIGNWFPLSRFPLVWALVGGLSAWAIVRWLDFGPEWTFAYTAAGAASALACRMRLA